MSEHSSVCIGGPLDGKIVYGVNHWVAWIPRNLENPTEIHRPPRNLTKEVVLNQGHYLRSGLDESGRGIYRWRDPVTA